MRDTRDPEELGKAILEYKKVLGVSICEAADRLDGLILPFPPSRPGQRAKIRPGIPPPDVAPQERSNGEVI